MLATPWLDDSSISEALLKAKSRLVDVEICVDSGSWFLPETLKLINRGVRVHPRATEHRMNSFFLVADTKILITGNFDLRSTGINSLSTAVLFAGKDIAYHYRQEFYLLVSGFIPADKDSDFDRHLGSLGALFNKELYIENQIFTDGGYIKGRWRNLVITPADFTVKPYFTPYPMTERDYDYFSLNEYGTWSPDNVEHAYRDFENDSDETVFRTDFINVLAPEIRNAEKNITILTFALNDPVIFSELSSAAQRGVVIDIYHDYDTAVQLAPLVPESFREMKNRSRRMMLCRPPGGGSLGINAMIIDGRSALFSCGGFTENAFRNSDSAILFFESAPGLIKELEMAVQKSAQYFSEYMPDKTYPADYRVYNEINRM
jgi:phosphatidylserine/phosphatidylglycerophosphate/cardiolipin synthase-like enzyme